MVRAEAAGDGHIVVRHGKLAAHRSCALHRPAAEGIAGLGVRGCHRHSLAVIDRPGSFLAVQHVLQRMGIHLPHGFIAPVASAAYSDDRRHFRGGTALPTLEGVSLPAGSRQLDFPALHRVAGRIALGIGTAVQLIADGVGNRRRGGIEVYLSRRHSGGRLAAIALRPLRHGIAGLGIGIQLVQTGTELPCVVDTLQYLVIYGVGDGIRHNAPVRRQLFGAGSAVERGIVNECIVIIPAGEGIALLCRLWQGAVWLIVGDSLALTRTAASRVKRHRVLIGRPLRLDGHIPCGHGGGNGLIPAVEGVARLGGVCGLGDSRAVVLRDSLVDRLTVLERQRVLVDRPLRRERHVTRRHGHVGRIALPALEGMSLLYRNRRRGDGAAIIHFSTLDNLVTVLERHRVLVDRPLRLDGHILRGHVRRNILIPTGESIARLGGVCRCGDLRAVVLRDGRNRAAAVRVERDRVLVDRPLRLDGHIPRWHGGGDLLAPPRKGIPCFGGVCGRGDLRAVVLRDGRNLAAAVRVERDRVLIDLPRCRNGHILCRHSLGNFHIPPRKGISRLGGILRRGDLRAVVLRDGVDLTAAVRVERDRVLVDLPLRLDGHVLRGHSLRNFLAPPREGIARLGRSRGCDDGCAELIGLLAHRRAVVGIHRQRIAIASVVDLHHRAAVGCDGGLRDRPGGEARIGLGCGGCRGTGGSSLVLRLVAGIAVIRKVLPIMLHLIVGVGVGRPPGGQSQALLWHGGGGKLCIAVVPPGEGIAGLGGGGEGNSLTGEGRDRIAALKGQCHLTTPLAPHKLVNRHRIASCNAVGLHGIAWQRPCFRADGTILGSCLHLRQRITNHDTGRQRIADQIVRVTVGGAAGEALVQLGIRPCGDHTAAGGLRNATKGSVDIQRTVDEQAAALTEAVSRQHAGRRIGLAAFIRLLPAIRYLQTSGHIQRSILRHSHRCTGHDAV